MPEDAVVYCADGVHPPHNSRSTYAWIEKGGRLEQPTVSGRDRVNVDGLLNAHDVTGVMANDCESVNAESTKEVYQSALARHPEASAIYIISDNARYCHNKKPKEKGGGRDKNQAGIPAALLAEPQFDLEVLEIPSQEGLQCRFLQGKREIQVGCQGFFRQYQKL